MKYSSANLKQMARCALIGRYGVIISAILVYAIISMAMVYFPVLILPGSDNPVFQLLTQEAVTFIIALILSVFEAGLYYMVLQISRGQNVRFSDLFYCFRNQPDKIILIQLLLTGIKFLLQIPANIYILNYNVASLTDIGELLHVQLVYMFLILIGQFINFFVTLIFSQSIFLAVDHSDISAGQALKSSIHLMKGNIGRYIYLIFSFFGFALLAVCSFGLAYLWVIPYLMVTSAFFYRNVSGEIG